MHVLCVAAIIAIFRGHNVGRHLKRSFSSVLGTKMIQMHGIPELEKAQEMKKTFHILSDISSLGTFLFLLCWLLQIMPAI